jgi:hypothetical protein
MKCGENVSVGGFAAPLVAALVLVGSACSGTSLSAESETELIAAAVARRTFVDSSVPGVRFTTVEVVDRVGSSDADGFISFSDDDRSLTAAEREAIEQALAPAEVRFITSMADRLVEFEDNGAVVTVARPTGDDSEATITTGLACGGTCGAGGAQRFELDDDGSWVFVENVGGQWIA